MVTAPVPACALPGDLPAITDGPDDVRLAAGAAESWPCSPTGSDAFSLLDLSGKAGGLRVCQAGVGPEPR